MQSLKTAMAEYYNYFREAQPEYEKFFRYIDNSLANEDEF
jgi:hypothetical protein